MTNVGLSARPIDSPARRSWRKFRTHRSAMIGGALVLMFVAAAVLAPLLPIPSPSATDWSAVRKPPRPCTGSALTRSAATFCHG